MEYGWSDAAYKVVLKNFSKGISWGKPKGKLSRSYRNWDASARLAPHIPRLEK
jgi:hypothetical protein